MDTYLEQLFAVIRLSSGQRLALYMVARELATAVNDTELLAYLERAVAHEITVRDFEVRWQSGSSRATYVPEMKPLDVKLDKHLATLRKMIAGYAEDVNPEVAAKASELERGIFPSGVGAITQLTYVDQAIASMDLIRELQTTYAEHVEFLGLSRKVESVIALVIEYNDTVRLNPNQVKSSELKAARARGHRYMLEVVMRSLGGHYDSDNPAHVAARNRLLKALFTQIEQTRERNQARRSRRRRNARDTQPDR